VRAGAPALALAFGLLAAALLASALPLAPIARLMPLVILVPTLAALLLELGLELRAARRGAVPRATGGLGAAVVDARRRARGGAARGDEPLRPRELAAIGVIVALTLAVDLLGSAIAVPAMMLIWLALRAGMPAWRAACAALVAFLAIHVLLGMMLEVALPPARLLLALPG
jgi:hypothetical protein